MVSDLNTIAPVCEAPSSTIQVQCPAGHMIRFDNILWGRDGSEDTCGTSGEFKLLKEKIISYLKGLVNSKGYYVIEI